MSLILLVHHGLAIGPEVDSMRPLSTPGRAASHRLAMLAAARGVKPDAVWHSGKLRARQTAELFWSACNPLAVLTAERGLQPGDPPRWIHDRLVGEIRSIVIVGHMPSMPRLLASLLGEPDDGATTAFPLHGCVALARGKGERGKGESDGETESDWDGDSWREVWRLES